MVLANSDEGKAYQKGEKGEDGEMKYPVDAPEVLAINGEESFPAEEAEYATPEGSAEDMLAVDEPVEDEGEAGGVDFASSAAEQKAADLGLTDADFTGHTPSGKTGFTAADVQQVADEKEAAAESSGGTITSDQVPAAG